MFGTRNTADQTRTERIGRGLGPFSGTQLTLIIGMLAAVVGVPMVASAVIPNGNTYNACALKTTGALRVIDTSKHQVCKATETKLRWSKTGERGPQGVPGADGTDGVTSVIPVDTSVSSTFTPDQNWNYFFLGTVLVNTMSKGQIAIVGSVTASLYSNHGAHMQIALCYTDPNTGVITPFASPQESQVLTGPTQFTVTQAAFGPDIQQSVFDVGLCVNHFSFGIDTVSGSGSAKGWLIVAKS